MFSMGWIILLSNSSVFSLQFEIRKLFHRSWAYSVIYESITNSLFMTLQIKYINLATAFDNVAIRMPSLILTWIALVYTALSYFLFEKF